jgi:cytochrome c553
MLGAPGLDFETWETVNANSHLFEYDPRLATPSPKWMSLTHHHHEKINTVSPRIKHLRSTHLLLFVLIAISPNFLSASNTKDAERAGSILFRDKGCTHCHGDDGRGTKKGPDLSALRKDKLWTPEKITNQILNGGQKMPSFSDTVTDEEAAQLVAFLRAKHKPVPPPAPPGSAAPSQPTNPR